MNKHAIYHRPESNYCFARDGRTIALRLRFERGERVSSPAVLYNSKYEIASVQHRQEMRFLCCDGAYDYYCADIVLDDPRLAYVFEFCESEGEGEGKKSQKYYFCEAGVKENYDFSLAYYDSFQVAYINENDIIKNISWLNNAVFYQVFVDRLEMGSQAKDRSYINAKWGELPTPTSFFGGDLDGVCRHLDRIKALGVSALYLNPIFKSPSNHKYDTVDYYEVDPAFGGNEAFARLVRECHGRGMKVMLDAVFNHVSEGFLPFRDVLEKGRESKYFDWFVIHGDRISPERDNYDCFAACKYMPKLNTACPEVQKYLTEVAKYYIREYDIDGWRLDVSDEVSHDFWRILRREVRAIKPDVALIGENWHNSESYLLGDQFDSIMNYGVTKAFLDFFARDSASPTQLAEMLNAQMMRYTDTTNEMMFNLLDCHDTDRFYSEVGGRAKRLTTALCALTFLPGSVNFYYGTELLTEGGYDPDNRRCFDGDRAKIPEVAAAAEEMAKILHLKKLPAIAHGKTRIYSENGEAVIERSCTEQTLRLRFTPDSYRIEEV